MCPVAWSLIPVEAGGLAVFLLLGGLSALLISAAKTGFGGTIGVLSFPLMVYAYGGNAMLAAGTTLPLLVVADCVALVSWWRKWNWRAARMMLPGAIVGIAGGAGVLWALRHSAHSAPAAAAASDVANAALMLIVGVISLGFVALQVAGYLRGGVLVFRPEPWQGAAAGTAAGVSSTLAHAAGPIATMYLLPQQMPKGRYVATTVLFFAIVNQVKLIPYITLGLINTTTLGAGLVLLPAVVLGAVAGLTLHGHVPQRQFTAVVYVLLTLAGVHMVDKGLAVLVG